MAVKRILQLFATLVTLVSVAPAFFYLDLPVQVSIFCLLISGFIIDRRNGRLLPPLPATLLSFVFFFFYLAQMSRNNIVEPLVNMLVLLLAVRLITEKSGRNLLQIFVLSTFILAASSLLSLSSGYIVSLILLVGLVTFGLLLTSFYATDPSMYLNRKQWQSLLRTGAIMPIGSLLLMLFFFVILPRTQYPLWNFLNPGSKSTSGFSEEVKPGSLANLGSSGEPAFRAQMSEIDPLELYWRGLVLNQTDGRNWSRSKFPPADQMIIMGAVDQKQVIFSESRTDRYLPGLDLPLEIDEITNQRFADGVFEAKHRLSKQSRFTVSSSRNSYLQLKKPQDRKYYLQTPLEVSSQMAAVVSQVALQESSQAKVQAVQEFFRRQQLSYSAQNLQITDHPVETFLFETKRGYCEYFASSFALLLRLTGVPARLVGGYLGGRYNQLGGYYLVDEDMAHVWVEALDDQNRWQRVDPSRLAINAGDAVTGLARSSFVWSQAAADYIENAWNRLVITYDLKKQMSLVLSTGTSLRKLQPSLPGNALWWVIGTILIIATVILTKRNQNSLNSQQRLLKKYQHRVCKSAGLKKLPQHLGLYKLAELSQEPLCQEFAQVFGKAVYRDEPLNNQQIAQLNKIIRQLVSVKLHLDGHFVLPCSSTPPRRCND